MTGFGKSEGKILETYYSVEVKSTNHRYFDLRYRAPGFLSLMEIPLTEWIRKEWFERGSLEVSIKPKASKLQGATVQGGTRIVVDEVAAESLMKGLAYLEKKYKTPKIPSLEMMALTNRVFLSLDASESGEEKWDAFKKLVGVALKDLKTMRLSEGEKLRKILEETVDALSSTVESIAELAKNQPSRAKERLLEKISSWSLEKMDRSRLEWEVAYYADRSDVMEEIDRLRSHHKGFKDLVKSKKPVGKQLDFLTQELHREVNTINSKASLLEITQLAVQAKTCIERLREQVQNVE